VDGWGPCDPAVLSVADATRVTAAQHQHNLSDCKSGRETCDYAQLTVLETKELARTAHQRNYTACRNGYGYCDRSQLTPTEANSIPSGHGLSPVIDNK
jgi:hypothetical protein